MRKEVRKFVIASVLSVLTLLTVLLISFFFSGIL